MPSVQMNPLTTASRPNIPADDAESLLTLARSAGMLVTLDGQIGREKYQSVSGSLVAFQRFATALREALSVPRPH
ncbi:hypothetical protein F4827_006787 [Paraburkholderia bannensis]|jgi:hypothetical protein|uniref:Uncharacterized protein n=1 Tax=Paraburkholderia bannensis TaxID=765414 RepID=A0A7W9U4K7_9BURK|nr:MULTISPECIES: hypothetical protein [Paraburkholderia]MBB3261913.1 hypothetical protein [Paraburkholderia sp. WP4_3_2]MBB6106908.1 hypothetical protein [Paraburkholderia bannensis]